jgi:hypothetical protein
MVARMRGYMFRNRWFALLFVGVVLAGTTRVVGTGDGDGAVDQAALEIAAQRERAEALSGGTETGSFDDSDVTVEFTADEELIDEALGEDPSPIDDFDTQHAYDPELVSQMEVVILP